MTNPHNTRKKSAAAATADNTAASTTTSSTTNTSTTPTSSAGALSQPVTSSERPKPNISESNKLVTHTKPPPLTPRPDSGIKLQETVVQLEREVTRLSTEALEKDNIIKKMEERLTQLEYDQMRTQSYFIVHNRTTTLLQQRISQLEQYTRRYSVIVKGLERAPGFEKHDSLVEEVKKLQVPAPKM